MEKRPLKQKTARVHSYEIAAALLVAVFIIPSFVLAQPQADPPEGNVDANFNSVTVTDGTDDNLVVNSDGSVANSGPNNGGRVVIRDNEGFSIFDDFSEIFNFSRFGLIIENTGIILNAPGFGGMSINNAGSGGLTVNATTGGLTVNATTGGIALNSDTGGIVNNKVGQPLRIGDELEVSGRVELTDTTDASGAANTGALEIANALRLDENEIITNTNTPLYLQHGNNGDLYVDSGTVFVDASTNNVGIGTTSPAGKLAAQNGNYFGALAAPSILLGVYGVAGYGQFIGGYFINESSSNSYALLSSGSTGVVGSGSSTGIGGYFRQDGSPMPSYANVASSSTGIMAYGNTRGGYFEDLNNSGIAYLGNGNAGVLGYGTSYGGYFGDSDSTGRAYIGYGSRGMWGYGSFSGGTFSNTNNPGNWADLGHGSYGILIGGAAGKPGGGSWSNSSDIRLKDVQGDYEKGLDEIVELHPVEFRYKVDNPKRLPSDEDYVGFIAQEVQKIFPEAVSEDGTGYLDFNMHSINVAVINAIQELKSEKDNEVAELRNEVAELKGIVCELKPTSNICH